MIKRKPATAIIQEKPIYSVSFDLVCDQDVVTLSI